MEKTALLFDFRSAKVKVRKSKSKVKLNFGLSADFSVHLKVSLSERLSQKL